MRTVTQQRRIRLTIAYDGTDFSGWQRQKHHPSVQEEIENRLSIITNEDIFLHGAGRTDAGVHAEAMVAHFDCNAAVTDSDFLRGLNAMLPGSIRILQAKSCELTFHARFSAIGKKYQYHLYTGPIQPPQLRLYSLHIKDRLDFQTIRLCLDFLEGKHDFSSFENTGTRDKSRTDGRGAIRTLYRTNLLLVDKNRGILEFTGDGFLKNMVRNMVGTLLEAGRGKITAEEFRSILLQKDRNAAGPTAPAHGLFLKEVYYEKRANTLPR